MEFKVCVCHIVSYVLLVSILEHVNKRSSLIWSYTSFILKTSQSEPRKVEESFSLSDSLHIIFKGHSRVLVSLFWSHLSLL